jgi:hypothetical protein
LRELRLIERATGARIRPAEVPSAAEVEARDLQVLEERLLDAVGKDGWARYRAVIQDLLGDYDPMDLAAAALTLAASAPRRGLGSRRAPTAVSPPANNSATAPPSREQNGSAEPPHRAVPRRPPAKRTPAARAARATTPSRKRAAARGKRPKNA